MKDEEMRAKELELVKAINIGDFDLAKNLAILLCKAKDKDKVE